jgi:uncharacterized membrane protein (DUF485 family)
MVEAQSSLAADGNAAPEVSKLKRRSRVSRENVMAGDVRSIENNPKFQELVAARKSLSWSLTALMIVIYFGFILLIAFDPKFLGTPIGSGVMTIGIPVGLFVIVAAFVLTGIYVARANATYDALTQEIVEESK